MDRTGTPKVVMGHQKMANEREVDYLSVFPVGISSWFARKTFEGSMGAILNGDFKGVATVRAIVSWISDLSQERTRIAAIHIHHLMRHRLSDVKRLLFAFPEIPITFFVHDYYLCCESYCLLRQDGSFCGGLGLSKKACCGCAYYESSVRHENEIWNLVSGAIDRVTLVCPSQTVKRILLNFHPEVASRCKIVPHQRFEGNYLGNLDLIKRSEIIKIGYLGSQQENKGWNQWTRLVASHQEDYDFIAFNGSLDSHPEGMRKVFVEYSPEHPDAMVEALRDENVDIAILWSSGPETYSYTCMEAYASNACIVTNNRSGNIADFVKVNNAGVVLQSDDELMSLFAVPSKVRAMINDFRKGNVGGPLKLVDNSAPIEVIAQVAEISAVASEPSASVSCAERLSAPLRSVYAVRESKKIADAMRRVDGSS